MPVANAAYELVQASQALQAVQALHHLQDPGSSDDIEPLTQDPTLLLTTMAPPLENLHLQLPSLDPYGYKEGLQANPELARALQVMITYWEGFRQIKGKLS